MAYQLRDALDAMQAESGVALQALQADGGPTANRQLMQFTADITATELAVAAAADCSALGAALIGLLGLGVFSSLDSIVNIQRDDLVYRPAMLSADANARHAAWQRAVQQVLAGVTN
jgi:glycerol kinase